MHVSGVIYRLLSALLTPHEVCALSTYVTDEEDAQRDLVGYIRGRGMTSDDACTHQATLVDLLHSGEELEDFLDSGPSNTL